MCSFINERRSPCEPLPLSCLWHWCSVTWQRSLISHWVYHSGRLGLASDPQIYCVQEVSVVLSPRAASSQDILLGRGQGHLRSMSVRSIQSVDLQSRYHTLTREHGSLSAWLIRGEDDRQADFACWTRRTIRWECTSKCRKILFQTFSASLCLPVLGITKLQISSCLKTCRLQRFERCAAKYQCNW